MIVRRKRTRNFTIVPNELWQDDRLSLEARGLQAYLLSLPDDWQINLDHLGTWAKVGRDKIRRVINELIEAGWIRRVRTRDPGTNAFVGMEYTVLDEPPEPQPENPSVGEPRPEKPAPEKPAPGNPSDLLRTESDQELKDTNPPTPTSAERAEPTSGGGEVDPDVIPTFERFWSNYPTSPMMSQAEAQRAWSKILRDTERETAIQAIEPYVQACRDAGRKIVDAVTFLKEKRYQGFAEHVVMAKPDGTTPQKVFVIEGSRAWDAWTKHRGRPFPNYSSHKGNPGWWADSLFPPGSDQSSQ